MDRSISSIINRTSRRRSPPINSVRVATTRTITITTPLLVWLINSQIRTWGHRHVNLAHSVASLHPMLGFTRMLLNSKPNSAVRVAIHQTGVPLQVCFQQQHKSLTPAPIQQKILRRRTRKSSLRMSSNADTVCGPLWRHSSRRTSHEPVIGMCGMYYNIALFRH